MSKRVPLEQQQNIIDRIKNGASINAIRTDTKYGVNILKRICAEHNVEVKNYKVAKNRINETFEAYFIETSTVGNMHLKTCIKQHNIIPHDKCYHCGLTEWLNGLLVLELDHINGNNRDNRLNNLRFLCPNCHSQTPTYRRPNHKGKKKVSDKDLKKALKEEPNIRKALIKVGLTPKGGNYERAYNLKLSN